MNDEIVGPALQEPRRSGLYVVPERNAVFVSSVDDARDKNRTPMNLLVGVEDLAGNVLPRIFQHSLVFRALAQLVIKARYVLVGNLIVGFEKIHGCQRVAEWTGEEMG